MEIAHLFEHPEELNQETLYELRRLVAIYPSYHATRILFLQNLFLLHDPTFDQELRRSALLVPDRRVLFAITQPVQHKTDNAKPQKEEITSDMENADTTTRLLDSFLQQAPQAQPTRRIKADPRTDYMGFLMQQDEEETQQNEAPNTDSGTTKATSGTSDGSANASQRMDLLIDGFIASQSERFVLSENPMTPEGILDDPDEEPLEQQDEVPPAENPALGGELTETLAQIYIKQKKYQRAIEVLTKLQSTPSAHRNPFFDDQVRFLQKLAVIEKQKTKSTK